MSTIKDTDLLVVNRGGVDYKATYADIKKGIGPQHIDPAPADWSFSPDIVGGDGSAASPFLLASSTVNTPGGSAKSSQTLSLSGLSPNNLVEFNDISTGAGTRFKQPLQVVPSSGQISIQLEYKDNPATSTDTTYTGNLQIGSTFFRWSVIQKVTAPPVINTVVLADSPEAGRFTSSTFDTTVTMTDDGIPASTKGVKAWVEGTLKSAAVSSAITNVAVTDLTVPGGTARAMEFKSADADRMTRTFTAAGNRKTWTWAGWVKLLSVTTQSFIFAANSASPYVQIYTSNSNVFIQTDQGYLRTTQAFRDPSAWQHWVFAFDTTQATASNRIKFYVNGAEITTWSVDQRSSISQNVDTGVNSPVNHAIGKQLIGSGLADLYLADVYFIDGQALDPSAFTTGTGTSILAKPYVGTYGTNGFHLDGLTPGDLGKDAAGSNDWTNNGASLVGATALTLTDTTDLANFAPGDAVTEVGNGDDATGTVGNVDVTAKTITLSVTAGTWDVGSQVKGPLKTQIVTITPESDEITAVNTVTAPVYSAGVTVSGAGYETGRGPDLAFDGLLTTSTQGKNATTVTLGSLVGLTVNTSIEFYSNGGNPSSNRYSINGISKPMSALNTWDTLPFTGTISSAFVDDTIGNNPTLSAVRIDGIVLVDGANVTTLTFKTDKDLAKFAGGDAINQEDSAASGTVGSVDVTAKTMTLATSTGTWGPANAGHHVIGPTKQVPASDVKLYCKLDASLNVTDLQSADPGYTTATGASPYKLTWPATLPSGQPPDTDLPAGTTLTTDVQATNSSGTVTKTSNTVTPV